MAEKAKSQKTFKVFNYNSKGQLIDDLSKVQLSDELNDFICKIIFNSSNYEKINAGRGTK